MVRSISSDSNYSLLSSRPVGMKPHTLVPRNRFWDYLKCIYLILVICRPTSAFQTTAQHSTTKPFLTECSATSPKENRGSVASGGKEYDSIASHVPQIPVVAPVVAPADRFHLDMRRVLESRARLASSTTPESSSTSLNDQNERRERPQVLQSDIDGAERVATMLQHMVHVGVATEESYQIVLKAYCDRGRVRWRRSDSKIVCAADEAEILLDELWSRTKGNITVDTCNLALQIYAVCSTPRGGRNYALRAQELLDRMEACGIEPNVESFSHLVHAWAWQQANMEAGECVQQAQSSLDRLLALSPDVDTQLFCYHCVLEAVSKSASDGSAQTADELLRKMIVLRKSADHKTSYPDAQSYSNAILAWCKSQAPGSAEKANALLIECVKRYERGEFPEGSEPELIAFNGVISAWGRNDVTKAEEVLWMLSALRSKCDNLIPDVMTYNSVLHAHNRNRDRAKSLERVLALVKYMEDNAGEQPAIKPNSFTYNTLMKAWLNSGRPEAADTVEQILHKMEDLWKAGDESLQPTSRHFNLVINVMAKSSEHHRARKAYELLQKMQASDKVDPDIITYTTVIECFSKSSDPQAAEIAQELLQQASDMYEATNDPKIMPNLRTFTMVILALSRNPRPGSVEKARDLLSQLLDLYEETQDESLRPNEYPFNYVLNCAANSLGNREEKIEAFQIATRTYQEMRKSDMVQPDSYTYAFWFKCCNNLLPMGDLRTKCVSYAFEQCKLDGLVSKEVLKRLVLATHPDILSKLLEVSPKTSPAVFRKMRLDDLPPAWSRNVRRARKQ